MPDRDPLDFLSPSIDHPVRPAPAFAEDLLDQLLADLEDVGSTPVVPLRPANAEVADDELTEASDDETNAETGSGVVLDLLSSEEANRATVMSSWMLRAAAVVLVAVGALALLGQRDDGSRSTTAADGRVLEPAEQVATDFLTARAAHNGEGMQELLADDVTIFGEYGVEGTDDYLPRAEFERLTNTEISEIFCQALTIDRVSCLFTLQTDIGRHLRAEQYEAEVVVTVRDGVIIDVLAAWKGITFDDDLVVFRKWLEQTHPEDLTAIVGGSTEPVAATPESGAVLAARTPEFAATTSRPITTVLAEDARFSTLVEGLDRNGVGNVLRTCSEELVTVFAPTDAAFDRYLDATGSDRSSVLGDAALFESFLVSGAITLTGVDGLGDQSIEAVTRSGATITMVGGAEPIVEGISILGDLIDVQTCNGVIQGVDDVLLPGN